MDNITTWQWLFLGIVGLSVVILRAIFKKDPFEEALPEDNDPIIRHLKEKIHQKKLAKQPKYRPENDNQNPLYPHFSKISDSHDCLPKALNTAPSTTKEAFYNTPQKTIQPTRQWPAILNQKGLAPAMLWSEAIFKRPKI